MVLSTELKQLPDLVGKELGPSDWILIDQDRINNFADVTEDHQWIHVDQARAAKETPIGKTIAHGFLTLSLLPALTWQLLEIKNVKRTINYGANKIRFLGMVPSGSRVRARQKLLKVEAKGENFLLTSEVTVEIEGQVKPALVAETLSLVG
jgi:acyl dehydratase